MQRKRSELLTLRLPACRLTIALTEVKLTAEKNRSSNPRRFTQEESAPPPSPILVRGPRVDLEAVMVKRNLFCAYRKALVDLLARLDYISVGFIVQIDITYLF
jgi:hypothetical protein